MPAYKYKKFLVNFAVHSNHIGFYPTTSPIKAFKNQLSDYKHATGSIQFPFSKELPHDLIYAICRFKLEEVKTNLNSPYTNLYPLYTQNISTSKKSVILR